LWLEAIEACASSIPQQSGFVAAREYATQMASVDLAVELHRKMFQQAMSSPNSA
jgi:hypothetical protein